jgi:excisionase family DNA binding protein
MATPLVAAAFSLADLASGTHAVEDVPPEAVPALLGELARLKAALTVRLLGALASSARPSEPGPLLTIPEVAERLRVPESYAYEMARTGRLPSVRFGKYVRVDPEALDAWIRSCEHTKALDEPLGSTYSPRYDRRGAAAHPKATRPHASRARASRRRDPEQHRTPGAGRAGHSRGASPAPDAAGGAANLKVVEAQAA